jgi:hypothetical protein
VAEARGSSALEKCRAGRSGIATKPNGVSRRVDPRAPPPSSDARTARARFGWPVASVAGQLVAEIVDWGHGSQALGGLLSGQVALHLGQ